MRFFISCSKTSDPNNANVVKFAKTPITGTDQKSFALERCNIDLVIQLMAPLIIHFLCGTWQGLKIFLVNW